ncbi:Proteinase inhibitor I9 [Cynara cardunculus var. scolymus]|uniref:Proteinase inhibitor I9 n=1 Tax=Cynara cardunculus var. scolymus TaxID=59895 RepID=A0A103YFZ3_CYNCS|nr:Proteinase inhibitor I9 [Cynara cardunculus var. scolymus]
MDQKKGLHCLFKVQRYSRSYLHFKLPSSAPFQCLAKVTLPNPSSSHYVSSQTKICNKTSPPLIILITISSSSQEDARESILYSYKHSFSGFSAKINSSQAANLASMHGTSDISVQEPDTAVAHN